MQAHEVREKESGIRLNDGAVDRPIVYLPGHTYLVFLPSVFLPTRKNKANACLRVRVAIGVYIHTR